MSFKLINMQYHSAQERPELSVAATMHYVIVCQMMYFMTLLSDIISFRKV